MEQNNNINQDRASVFANNSNIHAEFNSAQKRETVRSRIALLYVYGFFIVIFIGFFIGYLQEFKIDEYKEMLLTISAILSGSLGFIIGFYFKDSSDPK